MNGRMMPTTPVKSRALTNEGKARAKTNGGRACVMGGEALVLRRGAGPNRADRFRHQSAHRERSHARAAKEGGGMRERRAAGEAAASNDLWHGA